MDSASQQTRIQVLQDEKALLQHEKAQLEKVARQLQAVVAELKEKDVEREKRHQREREVQNKAVSMSDQDSPCAASLML
ncbi:hypothetical protein AK812_SmicGene19216 [Symbiodinium microadriaticum]|uniref:Uncharacterized protein n=1 Tax=Symbiodinium microadriaticum TaxID=2951 RepID=A0A1Q9DT54_SYMMI|nr:hypothetical protein AK812_SmicGene19216 [Symbiodinium microadriaticum]